ncbi:MAG: DUF3419 family protein [Gammaproteobacteria bacterium]
MSATPRVDALHDRLFHALHSHALVYNTCWEDPAIDRQVLELGPEDELLVIASAGCNVLDYALAAPARIHAVDLNPRQIALNELKLAGLRALDYEDFFAVFGKGRHARFEALYHHRLRWQLSPFAQTYWDHHGRVFQARDEELGGLYFHGLAGKVARGFHLYLRCRPRLRAAVDALLDAPTLDAQREVFERRVAPLLWRRELEWLLSRQFTLALLGVPRPQRHEVEAQHAGGVAAFVREAITHVFRELPIASNYFWRVYLTGGYTPTCCPEYLKPGNFARLRDGLVDRIELHTGSVTGFLRARRADISRFVLLDHMDWMAGVWPAALADEWQAILDCARDGARVVFRSAHATPAYLDAVRVDGGQTALAERLVYHPALTRALQPFDRVQTYAGFHVADVVT